MRLFPGKHPDKQPGNRLGAGRDDHLIPLINVVFLMLIFFMIAGAIVPPTPFPVTPPASTAARADAADGLVLVLDADGQLALDGAVILPDELAGRLSEYLAERSGGRPPARAPERPSAPAAGALAGAGADLAPATPSDQAPPNLAVPPTLTLKADAEVSIALLRATLAQLRAAGVERVSLLTLRTR